MIFPQITDVNNLYLHDGNLTHAIVDGLWSDAGTFESLIWVSNQMANRDA